MKADKKQPSLLIALIPIIALIGMLGTNVLVFGSGAIDGANQLVLLIAAAFAGIISWRLGYTWNEINEAIIKSISSAMTAIIILLVIGSLAGTWLLSGIVPAMIYYGLKILNPTFFLLAACVVSSIVSLATGSSWTTVATVGIALLGIGKAMGISEGITAGAIISGAYFGDKMSPLSDTTNLAPAMAGTDLITHVKYMVITTTPSLLITLAIFLGWGFTLDTTTASADTDAVLLAIDNAFNLSPLLFLVPAIVLFMIIKKTPAAPALLVGALLGGLLAVFLQPDIIEQVATIHFQDLGRPELAESSSYLKKSFIAVMNSLTVTVDLKTDHPMITELLTSKGMYGMLNTIWLIICAMIFGGAMEASGLLKVIAERIIRWAHNTGSLVLSTAATCIFFNFTASDQYMAIAIPGRMYRDTYRKRKYAPELLSRTLEDSGTVTSVLIPWNTCGATQASVLGVATAAYAPYCFFNIISPLMTVLVAYLNIKIRRLDDTGEN
jgi:NhaC family Na+:H+ antiporter